MSELRDAENASAGRLLVAESNLADAVSAQALDRRATLVAASVPWTPEFEAEQDRLFDAAQRGDELPPLSVRLAAAADYAVAAAADAEQARSAVSDWNSSASMRLRENGFVTFSQALGR
jgi:ABC-type branched-subunit amino acid transport system substrate-binding protein